MNEFKNWLYGKLTEIKSWLAFIVMVCAVLHLPYAIFFWVSLVALLLNNDYLQNLILPVATEIKTEIEKATK